MKTKIVLLTALLSFGVSAQATDIKSLERELLYRTAQGSASDVKTLLEHTKNPNLTNEFGQSLLYIAAFRADQAAMSIVQTLVESGAKVNEGGEGKHYPLIAAIQSGNAEMIRYLLKHGADYRLADAQGVTAAEHATQSLSPEASEAVAEQVKRDNEAHALLSSPQGELKLRYDLAYHSCAYQYYSFYYQSKQDDIDEATQKATLMPHERAISLAMGGLRYYFKYDKSMQQDQFNAGKKAMFDEMESLISNRWRRQQGIGQAGDMEKRCEPIAKRLQFKKKPNKF